MCPNDAQMPCWNFDLLVFPTESEHDKVVQLERDKQFLLGELTKMKTQYGELNLQLDEIGRLAREEKVRRVCGTFEIFTIQYNYKYFDIDTIA